MVKHGPCRAESSGHDSGGLGNPRDCGYQAARRDRRDYPQLRLLAVAIATGLLLSPRLGTTEESSAPATVQAQIMARLLPFDRGFAGKNKGEVVVVLLEKPGNSDSASAVKQMSKALGDVGKIGGSPVKTVVVPFGGAGAAAAACKGKGAHAAYISPGLGGEAGAIAGAFAGSSIVTFAAVEAYVSSGISVGVAVVGGKPQMSINLAKARAQKIDFPATVLKLAKVY